MSPRFILNNPGQEQGLVRRRIYFAVACVFLLCVVLLARISYLQIVQHSHFATLSQHNRVKIVPIPPMRGLIFSSDGVLLADNRPSFSLEITPELVSGLDAVVQELASIITIDAPDIQRFREQLAKKRRFESVPLKFNLSDEEVARVSVNLHRFPGVDVIARLNRYYPLGENVSHAIGYVGMIDEKEIDRLDRSNYAGTTHIGKTGVEQGYEDILHGSVGYQQVEVNAQGRVIRVLDREPPVPGRNIYLTLNVSLQNLAMEILGERKGAIVAIEPGSGGILALASSPGYDPNLFVNGIDRKSYQALLASKATPLLNRALQGKYPPGSTIKPFLAFAALDFGVRDLAAETWCPGWYTLKGSSRRYRDWKKEGHGHLNLTQAVAQSCDVYFYDLANDLGIDRLQQGFEQFGFGARTGIDIAGESAGLVPSRRWKEDALGQPWYPGETLILGIGQGSALVTPLQLANATATVANHGRVKQPHLFSFARDAINGAEVARADLQKNRFVAARSAQEWEDVIYAMMEVVHGARGTARRTAAGAPYRYAGKTGTAQVISIAQDEEYDAESVPEELRDHALFVAFAPVEAPRIAVAVVIENGGGGSATAAPVARQLFDHYFGVDDADHG